MPLFVIQVAVDVQIHRIDNFLLGLGKIFSIKSSFQDDACRKAIAQELEKVLNPVPIVVNIKL